MGEKETAVGKASGGKQVEEQRWVQDDTPEGETGLEAGKASGGKQVEEQKMQPGGGGAAAGLRSAGKSSPELMLRAVASGQVDPTPAQTVADVGNDAGDSASNERGMNSIRNLK